MDPRCHVVNPSLFITCLAELRVSAEMCDDFIMDDDIIEDGENVASRSDGVADGSTDGIDGDDDDDDATLVSAIDDLEMMSLEDRAAWPEYITLSRC